MQDQITGMYSRKMRFPALGARGIISAAGFSFSECWHAQTVEPIVLRIAIMDAASANPGLNCPWNAGR